MSTLSTLLKPLLEVTHDRLVHTDGQERLEYWGAFQKLWGIFPENDVPYGHLYNRHMIGNILFIVTRAVERARGKAVPALEGSFPDSSFQAWSADDWDMLSEYLKAAAENLKRMDANSDVKDAENSKPDPERCLSPALNSKVEKVLRYIKVYKITSPIRSQLMTQLVDKSVEDDEFPNLPKTKVAEVWSYCIEEEDQIVQDQFARKIFETSVNDKTPPLLRTIGELREAFSDKPFNFDRFDDRMDILMGEWCAEFFNEPRLTPFYFPDNLEIPGPNPIEILNNLRTKRRNLRNTGDDPLQDSLRLAELATVPAPAPRDPPDSRRASSLYKRKHSATQLQFEEEEDVESEDPNGDGTHHLSSLPTRGAVEGDADDEEHSPKQKKRKSQQKKYRGKRPWNEEEKTAIIEGIRYHGKGNWAEIKEEYDVLFSMRTSGQIKDCFRRMYVKGEIPKDLIDGWEAQDKEITMES